MWECNKGETKEYGMLQKSEEDRSPYLQVFPLQCCKGESTGCLPDRNLWLTVQQLKHSLSPLLCCCAVL